ncbi:MAG TPA: class I SAM-dependent methyltransferase [Thermoleophilaceae bacterium]|nr:class I SAM-dependent methyltransferase [Thermoleophilaceae bacterium]
MDGATPAAVEAPGGRYPEDLAYIHASGFSELAAIAGPAIVGLLRDAGIDGGLVVDLGCGNGMTSRSLLEAGYDVLGIDTSQPFLRRARREAPGARFRQGSFLDEPLPECSGVIAVGEVLAYTQRSLEPVFRRVYRALRPGGLFVFDLPAPGRVPNGGPARSWRQGDDWAILVATTEDRRRRLLRRRMTTFRRTERGWRRGREAHLQRLHPPSATAARLRRLGFRVRTRRGYTGKRFAPGHYVVVARKASGARARPRRGTGED